MSATRNVRFGSDMSLPKVSYVVKCVEIEMDPKYIGNIGSVGCLKGISQLPGYIRIKSVFE